MNRALRLSELPVETLLASHQQALLDGLTGLDEATLRAQRHDALSCLGWHIGHCAFIEALWADEILLGGNTLTRDFHGLYLPERSPKGHRGDRLPELEALVAWVTAVQNNTRRLLADPPSRSLRPDLLADDYLAWFLAQHHAQHLETMQMVRCAALRAKLPLAPVTAAAREAMICEPPDWRWCAIGEGDYVLGLDHAAAYDNEQPPRRVRLRGQRIAATPVSCGQFAAFMADDGYHRAELWSEPGWRWRETHHIETPHDWHWDDELGWQTVQADGQRDMDWQAPVSGVSWYEAAAFTRWAGAALPHEYLWEAADRQGLLEGQRQVWEWCSNRFHPYPGFRAHPYDNYSLSWFDGAHYVLRGGSRHTLPPIARPSFRNYYQPWHRHIFAGLRLAR